MPTEAPFFFFLVSSSPHLHRLDPVRWWWWIYARRQLPPFLLLPHLLFPIIASPSASNPPSTASDGVEATETLPSHPHIPPLRPLETKISLLPPKMGEANLRIPSLSSTREGKAAFNSELCCFSGENQFFISGLSGDDIIQNCVLEALYRRIMRAKKEKKCFRVIIVLPLLLGFQGDIDDGGAESVRALKHWQYRTICRGPRSILQNLYDHMGPEAHDYISFYGLRTYGRLCDGGILATNQDILGCRVILCRIRVRGIIFPSTEDKEGYPEARKSYSTTIAHHFGMLLIDASVF